MSAIKTIDTASAEDFLANLSPDSKLWGGYPGKWIYRGQAKTVTG